MRGKLEVWGGRRVGSGNRGEDREAEEEKLEKEKEGMWTRRGKSGGVRGEDNE